MSNAFEGQLCYVNWNLFEILSTIETGAYATIYKTKHQEKSKTYAIKFNRATDHHVKEVEILGDVKHKNVMSIIG